MNLSGKVLVVTGSDCALGQAVASTLSGYGARLALLEHAAAPSAPQPAGALRFGGIDLTLEDTARSAMERIVKATASDAIIISTNGSHQLRFRRMSVKVLLGATNVSTTRSTWLNPGPIVCPSTTAPSPITIHLSTSAG